MILSLMSEVFSSKQRSLRVEAQKLLWTLFRYKNMVLVLNTITDLRDLVWDGYSTFQHCSPLDPDFQTHLCFRWDMDRGDDVGLVRMWDTQSEHELLSLSTRDILETCARCVYFYAFSMAVILTFPHLSYQEKIEDSRHFQLASSSRSSRSSWSWSQTSTLRKQLKIFI